MVIVPAFGVISEVLATSSRRSIFGYKSMVFALAGIGVVAFIVYGHHMFTSGMSPVLRFVTMVTTMLVAVPTGIKIFNWLKTMHGGSLVYRTHTLWALGFLVTFTLGGISGMFFPSIAMDTHLHESYFVVAHFHYVLVGGTVFGFFAAIYYWYPKMTGRMMDERLGTLHFLTAFISYNGVFWPMHRLGVWGMARRHHTYFISTDDFANLPPEAQIGICSFQCPRFCSSCLISSWLLTWWYHTSGCQGPCRPVGWLVLRVDDSVPTPNSLFWEICGW